MGTPSRFVNAEIAPNRSLVEAATKANGAIRPKHHISTTASTWFDLFPAESTSYPIRVTAQINHRPNRDLIRSQRVENTVWKHPA
jgi:hypothetical protein